MMRGRPQLRTLGGDLAWFILFFTLVATVFYLLGPLIGNLSPVMRANLPGSALGVVCPALAAGLAIVVRGGGKDLLRYLRPPRWSWWWLPAVGAAPLAATYELADATSTRIPALSTTTIQ